LLLIRRAADHAVRGVYYVPQFMQTCRASTRDTPGLACLRWGADGGRVPVGGKLYDRIGPGWPALVGMIGSVGGLWLMTASPSARVGARSRSGSRWPCWAGAGHDADHANGLSWLPPHLVG